MSIDCLTCQYCFSPSYLRNSDALVCRHETFQGEGNRIIGNMKFLKATPTWCPKEEMLDKACELTKGIVVNLDEPL